MRVRPETAADYAAVARVHVRAFGDRADEAVIVALLRQRASYTPGLSLVAEVDGVIAGHVLFTPGILPLMGQAVPAVLLAPLAVDPAFQRRGIGGALIEAGHEAARQHGAALSLLLGHPEYYPRFGYQVQSYGIARCVVDVAALPATGPLTARKPAAADLPALMRLWEHEEGAVDFSLRPDAALLDWLSPNPLITATVYERGGSVVGFTRIHQAAPAEPRLLLAADVSAAQAMAHAIASSAAVQSLTLPLHPASASAALGTAAVRTFDPALAAELIPGALGGYLAGVRAGQRPPGRPLWPTAFDLA